MGRIYRTCADCGHQFYISDKDQNFFNNRCTCGHDKRQHDPDYSPSCEKCDCEFFAGLELPKRCFGCRRKTKIAAQEEIAKSEPNPNGGTVEFFTEEPSHWTERHSVRARKGNKS
jgi:hypothetical protein